MLYRPMMGYRVGNHSRTHMKNYPVQINRDCTMGFLKIKKELMEAISEFATFSEETPRKGKTIRNKNIISIQRHKDKDFFLSVKIYVSGCNVFWLININTKKRDPDLKEKIITKIKELREQKGYRA